MSSIIMWLKRSDFPVIKFMREIYRRVYFFLKREKRPIKFMREIYRRVYFFLKREKRPGNFYLVSIPSTDIRPDLDFLLLQLPSRYTPMLPNGIGYVHNILKRCGIKYQILDANIIFYHRYHSQRLLGKVNPVIAPNGYVMKEDPWDNTNAAEWDRKELIEYFWPQIEEVLQGIAANRPKAVGLSIHETNRTLSNEFIKSLRIRLPEVVVVVGGYDCVYYEIGPRIITDFDYMVIGEAELSLEPLVRTLAGGERPKDLTGIVSRYDTPDREWIALPVLEDLDSIDFPKYEWTDISLYREYSGGHLIPIAASRGCHWGKCRFCAECFPFRKRSPQKVVDEIEFMVKKGLNRFHFNESDVNGDPQNLHDICSEIIRRKSKVQLMGQLRIDKRNTKEYFKHLAKAGFVHLRFGVDGWSKNTLRLQRKGYNTNMVFQNLRDCRESGIYTTANIVIGIPGETEDDVNEMIENMVKCKNYIDLIESFNTLLLYTSSEYYKNSEQYNIRFRGDKSEIYRNNPQCIPTDLWYSDNPYIDQEVRIKRLNKICTELYRQGVKIGPFASIVVENLKRG